jgi:hypothetical protein
MADEDHEDYIVDVELPGKHIQVERAALNTRYNVLVNKMVRHPDCSAEDVMRALGHYLFGIGYKSEPERVDPTEVKDACILLMNAMAKFPRDSMFKKFINPEVPRGKVDVVLLVNGVRVPFLQAVGDQWKALEDSHDKLVLSKAKDLVSAAGLQRIENLLTNLEFEIGNTLEEAQKKIKEQQK